MVVYPAFSTTVAPIESELAVLMALYARPVL